MAGTPNPLWFLDRSSGEVALLLLSAAVALGIMRSALPAFQPFLIEGIHRNLTLIAIAFGGIHIVAAVADPFAGLNTVDVLVPFLSAYRTTWLGLGVISLYLFAGVLLSSWPVRHFGRVAWQWLHRVAYAGWVAAVVHSLGAGSDARNPVFLSLDIVAVVGVLVAFVGVRVAESPRGSRTLKGLVGLAAILTVVVIAVWAADGPMRPGWARSSGTPPGLLHSP
ncbi:MAG: methionine sulfoxide reductase heme-binding subunit [Chloroflexota bacterium]|nr:methionine sulfoxide reductase heme-binding subunit [Chloroflexota bacterium]